MTCPELPARIGDLILASPVIAASGVWPLDPDLWPKESLAGLGAVCSKGLTQEPRQGNPGLRLWETPCGLLNSIGLQNDGLDHFLEHDLDRLIQEGPPVVVNLAPHAPEEFEAMFGRLNEAAERIAAVELNVSCPNVSAGGMAWGRHPGGAALATRLARRSFSGRLWVKLTPQAADLAEVARAVEAEGADAVVVANTWLGLAMDVERRRPVFDRAVAGLSGPAVFPLALRCVWEVRGAVKVPVVGCGGVSGWAEAAAMILAGAAAVEVGTGLLTDLNLPGKIVTGLADYLARQGLGSLAELQGAGRRMVEGSCPN
jgi:dihydroorotate dehydrogenase (NAD+) catalytic subunit